MTVGLKADLQEMKSSLEDVRSAEKDANSRLADMVGRMGVSSSENERLRGDVKALEGTLAAERIESELMHLMKGENKSRIAKPSNHFTIRLRTCL